MNALPKIGGYLALVASLVATYFAQTGHVPPAWISSVLVLLATVSHSITGTGSAFVPSTTINVTDPTKN
jgi:hypothetical protein